MPESDSAARHPLHPLPDVGRTFVAAFESTYQPAAGVDALDVTGHVDHWEQDLEHFLSAGVRHVRYPLRWQRIQPSPGAFDWSETDRVLGRLHDRGAVPIVDLVHHTTYPDWLTDGFRGADFAPAYLRYAEAVAVRYPGCGPTRCSTSRSPRCSWLVTRGCGRRTSVGSPACGGSCCPCSPPSARPRTAGVSSSRRHTTSGWTPLRRIVVRAVAPRTPSWPTTVAMSSST